MNETERNLALVLGFLISLLFYILLVVFLGVVIAYLWNTFLIPNVDLTLPIISWWKVLIGFWLIRTLKVVLFGK